MSVTPEKRKGELTGKWVARYRLAGKRYHVGTYSSERVAKVAERVHRLGIERLKSFTLEDFDTDLIDEAEHTPWRPVEYRLFTTRLLDNLADGFYKWRKNRRIQKALENDTYKLLQKMDTKQTSTMFDK